MCLKSQLSIYLGGPTVIWFHTFIELGELY